MGAAKSIMNFTHFFMSDVFSQMPAGLSKCRATLGMVAMQRGGVASGLSCDYAFSRERCGRAFLRAL
jgi:hypothetical protein